MAEQKIYDGKLWSELTQEEVDAFREDWITDYHHDLIHECGEPDDDTTKWVASVRFEEFCGQEGWTGRDLRIASERAKEREEARSE